MLQSQRLQVRSSEIKSKLNELANADNITAEQSGEIDRLRNELTSTLRRSTAPPSRRKTPTDAAADNGESPEKREAEELRKRASLGVFVDSRLRGPSQWTAQRKSTGRR